MQPVPPGSPAPPVLPFPGERQGRAAPQGECALSPGHAGKGLESARTLKLPCGRVVGETCHHLGPGTLSQPGGCPRPQSLDVCYTLGFQGPCVLFPPNGHTPPWDLSPTRVSSAFLLLCKVAPQNDKHSVGQGLGQA